MKMQNVLNAEWNMIAICVTAMSTAFVIYQSIVNELA